MTTAPGEPQQRHASLLFRWLLENWFRIATLALLLVVLFTIRQHLADVQAEQVRASTEMTRQRLERDQHERRAYAAKRRNDCYDIYARERAHFNNVVSLDYDYQADLCEVVYRHTGSRATNSTCQLARDSVLARGRTRFSLNLRMDCDDNNFRKVF